MKKKKKAVQENAKGPRELQRLYKPGVSVKGERT